ncbi:hypothetical protein [Pseudidiomarina sediminum]|uniref:hypothetical protein n=1 Tax=Pseudidiomarina sediminum TaxID=431675 RepID=UPI001C965618|nr:hypothetical protein [Pseudidiomarina sediminum]MBY6063310.1 hypothetical protein [Pseudidiomarina sediminum]
MRNNNSLLLVAATSALLAAFAHLVCIVWGPDGYRFFGAGEQMARLAEQGHWYPVTITLVIAGVLTVFALYALSGAGIIRRLPLLRFALLGISLVFLARALGFVAIMPMFPENSLTFWLVSSGICFIIGASFAYGTYQSWRALSKG